MIKLTDLLKEMINNPKAIIMAGGASVGKSTVLKSLQPVLKGFVDLNADKYVEDKNSPMYGNLSAASVQIRKTDLPNAVDNQQNLIYDTTASNLSTLQPTLNKLNDMGYETMMIMVYAHPIVSFLRNYKRERKVPATGVLGTWANVYNLLEDYKRIFGDNGQFQSTFRKDDSTLSPEELKKREKDRAKTKVTLDKSIDKIADTYDSIQANLNPVDSKELPNLVKKFVG